MPQVKSARQTSRGIVLHDGAVLLIERWRVDEQGNKLHYFSIPGGKIERGETPEVAVVRELFEETSLLVRPNRLVAKQKFENGDTNMYFLCNYLSGKPVLHASATEKQLPSNRSKPCWKSLKELEDLPLNEVYEPVRKLIVRFFKNDLPEKPVVIK